MMTSYDQKEYMFCPIIKKSSSGNDEKTKVMIDGFAIYRNRRVTICSLCARTKGCSCDRSRSVCTSAGYWVELKKKYRWKIMGRYRLSLYIQKEAMKHD